MTFPCLLLGLALIGGKILPPDSIVPPDDGAAARYYEQIGLALASWGADQAAVRNFEQALKRDPQRLTTRLALARSMASLGLGLPAVQQVELVMKADPRNLAAQRLYGKLMLYGGQVPQARKILGSLAGIAEIAKASFDGKSGTSPPPPPRTPNLPPVLR